jgi:hypothetical protein
MSNYYLGQNPLDSIGDTPRFFYGLRKNSQGSVFLVKVDQIKSNESVQLNQVGEFEDNYNDFEVGVDFFEGIDVNHDPVFANLRYQQYRWDDRSILYYINDDGELVARINDSYTYSANASED